jgi:hypothetical protein
MDFALTAFLILVHLGSQTILVRRFNRSLGPYQEHEKFSTFFVTPSEGVRYLAALYSMRFLDTEDRVLKAAAVVNVITTSSILFLIVWMMFFDRH